MGLYLWLGRSGRSVVTRQLLGGCLEPRCGGQRHKDVVMRGEEHLTIAECTAAPRPTTETGCPSATRPALPWYVPESLKRTRCSVAYSLSAQSERGSHSQPSRPRRSCGHQSGSTPGVVLLVIRAADGQLLCGFIPKVQEHDEPFSPVSPVKPRYRWLTFVSTPEKVAADYD